MFNISFIYSIHLGCYSWILDFFQLSVKRLNTSQLNKNQIHFFFFSTGMMQFFTVLYCPKVRSWIGAKMSEEPRST